MNNIILNICVIGNELVGKTSLIEVELYKTFDNICNETSWIKYYEKKCNINNKSIKVNIWELSDKESNYTMIKEYLQNMNINCIIFVFDITNKKSFTNINKWLSIIHKNNNIEYMLLGNKNDKNKERTVNINDIIPFAIENNMIYFDVSAKNLFTHNFINYIVELLVCNTKSSYLNKKHRRSDNNEHCTCNLL